MSTVRPIISRVDKERLEAHLAASAAVGPASRVRQLLAEAKVVPPDSVPADIVTMNSRIALREPAGDAPEVYVLAYPGQEGDGALSVLSPLGSALLAAREGEKLLYMGARFMRSVVLEAIEYQPEREGNFDL